LLLLAFLALSLVVITLDFRGGGDGPLERAKDISTTVVAPIQRGLTAVFRPVGNFFSSLGDLSRLRAENAELERALDAAEGEIERAEAIQSENVELRDISGLNEPYTSMDDVTAEVIATVPANYRWAVKIDKGSADGIEEDMAVIAESGLVGKVIRADATSSIVLLLIDPNAGARSRIEDKGYAGNIRGNGADEPLSMRGVNPEANVSEGDTVVTSGFDGGIFPPSIPIGRVIRTSGEGALLEQEIDVEPFVDFTTLDFVKVLLGSGPRLDEATEDKKATEDKE
jgi:rod shape-determining protein MreC